MNESKLNRRSRNANIMESTDPVAMLKEDHSKVKDLFDKFEATDDERTQMQIARKAINELKVHAAIEEEIFYPGVRSVVDDAELMSEATEEHHVVHFLINELDSKSLDHDTFHAKFIVLAENVRHHIKEEEGEMLPKIDMDETQMEQLGGRMARRKQELMENPDALKRATAGRDTQSNRSGKSRQSSRGESTGSTKSATRTSSRGGSSTQSTSRSTSSKKSGKSGSSRSTSRSSSPRASR